MKTVGLLYLFKGKLSLKCNKQLIAYFVSRIQNEIFENMFTESIGYNWTTCRFFFFFSLNEICYFNVCKQYDNTYVYFSLNKICCFEVSSMFHHQHETMFTVCFQGNLFMICYLFCFLYVSLIVHKKRGNIFTASIPGTFFFWNVAIKSLWID